MRRAEMVHVPAGNSTAFHVRPLSVDGISNGYVAAAPFPDGSSESADWLPCISETYAGGLLTSCDCALLSERHRFSLPAWACVACSCRRRTDLRLMTPHTMMATTSATTGMTTPIATFAPLDSPASDLLLAAAGGEEEAAAVGEVVDASSVFAPTVVLGLAGFCNRVQKTRSLRRTKPDEAYCALKGLELCLYGHGSCSTARSNISHTVGRLRRQQPDDPELPRGCRALRYAHSNIIRGPTLLHYFPSLLDCHFRSISTVELCTWADNRASWRLEKDNHKVKAQPCGPIRSSSNEPRHMLVCLA